MRIFLLLLMFPLIVSGQGPSKKGAYFFDITKAQSLQPYDQQENSLNIQYYDRYGKDSDILLVLSNWRNEEVGRFTLAKSFGMNHFKIDISEVFEKWKEGEIYSCRMHDEVGKQYELLLRKKEIKLEGLELNIVANPVKFSCKEVNGNFVDFYSTISGGKGPYSVQWYIMNETKSEFLYQPKSQIIDRPGKTMVVGVDKNPNYYVMVLVTDACKREARQMVYLTCSENKKKINTVFVEPLKGIPTPSHL